MKIIEFIVLICFCIDLTLTFNYQVKQDYTKANYWLTLAILMYLIFHNIANTGV